MQIVPNQAQPKIFRGSPNCSYDKTCPSNISLKIPKPMPIQNRLSNSAPECNGSTGKEGTQGLQVGSHCGLRYHASGHAFFLSRKASRFTHEYFMYAKVKMLLLSSRFVCVILALSLHENPRQFITVAWKLGLLGATNSRNSRATAQKLNQTRIMCLISLN